ncbi:MAG: ABC transporter ATP-binding protein [Fimbriimonas sp.]
MMTDRAIHLENLEFRWSPSAPPILAIESLSVDKGERVFLQGPSGGGKSTLLSLITGVLTPNSGRVEVLGEDIARMRPSGRDRFRADHIGLIFQMFNLVPYLSVVENVMLPCRFSSLRRGRATESDAVRLLAHLGLSDPVLLRRQVSDLSVGEQQRTAAARALLGSPEIIIADEPTSALDADSRDAFIQTLLAECDAQGTTVLFVSHDAQLARHFDRAVSLREINGARK